MRKGTIAVCSLRSFKRACAATKLARRGGSFYFISDNGLPAVAEILLWRQSPKTQPCCFLHVDRNEMKSLYSKCPLKVLSGHFLVYM